MQYIVYSDLDGTLLDHDSYSFEEASEALNYLQTNSIPLVLVTSKTFSEVKPLQARLQIECPFIVENGAGIYIPSKSVLADVITTDEPYIKLTHAQTYLELRLLFKQLQLKYAIRGFGDMQLDEVIELTSLKSEDAQNAMKRDFTEPFIADKSVDIEALREEVRADGLDIVKGGRFYHLVTRNEDKAKAMLHLTHLFEEYFNHKVTKIALGDSANDFTMLLAADKGVLIPHSNGTYANINSQNVIYAPYAGPKGWNCAIMEIFHEQ